MMLMLAYQFKQEFLYHMCNQKRKSLPELCLVDHECVLDQQEIRRIELYKPSRDRAMQQETLLDPSCNAEHLQFSIM